MLTYQKKKQRPVVCAYTHACSLINQAKDFTGRACRAAVQARNHVARVWCSSSQGENPARTTLFFFSPLRSSGRSALCGRSHSQSPNNFDLFFSPLLSSAEGFFSQGVAFYTSKYLAFFFRLTGLTNFFFFLSSGGWMGKNKALAHHTSTYFHTRVVCRFNSVAFAAQR